jgi:hypothetical protein
MIFVRRPHLIPNNTAVLPLAIADSDSERPTTAIAYHRNLITPYPSVQRWRLRGWDGGALLVTWRVFTLGACQLQAQRCYKNRCI